MTGGAAIAALLVLSRNHKSKTNRPIIQKLTSENITAGFIAAIPEITPELNLELATATQTETFTKSNTHVLWGLIDLGTSTVQIRVPVTYRYHLCLREPWRLEIQQQRIMVLAPMFRPALPPAIHTNQLQTLSVRGWGRSSTTDLLTQMQKEITPLLSRYANDPKHLALVEAQCRQSVAEFVQLWLEREGQWGRQGFTEVQVQFKERQLT